MKTSSAVSVICLLTAWTTVAQTIPATVALEKKSSISIDGTSNIANFRFTQSCENFIEQNLVVAVTYEGNKLLLDKNELHIPVKRFNSKNKLALRDFFKMVNAENYPAIRIQLRHIELQPEGAKFEAIAVAEFTIASVTKGYSIPIKVSKNDDTYTFIVKKEINILDFGLSPPKHILNMVKVNEWINIDMNVVCNIVMYENISDNS